MRAKDYKKRNSFSYKIKMWFYRLTLRDVMSTSKIIIISVINFIMVVLGFLILFFGPSFFWENEMKLGVRFRECKLYYTYFIINIK